MLSKRVWVEGLESACLFHGSCEHWRMRGDVVERGYEIHCRGGSVVRWEDVPFLSTFLLARRAEQLAAQTDGIPF